MPQDPQPTSTASDVQEHSTLTPSQPESEAPAQSKDGDASAPSYNADDASDSPKLKSRTIALAETSKQAKVNGAMKSEDPKPETETEQSDQNATKEGPSHNQDEHTETGAPDATEETNAVSPPISPTSTKGPQSPISPLKRGDSKSSQRHHRHSSAAATVSEWSHQQLAPQKDLSEAEEEDEGWQTMPAYAPYDIYDDDGKLIARERHDSDEEGLPQYRGFGGKGYSKVQVDEDAQSATSLDENTAYLFKNKEVDEDDEENFEEELRDPLAQIQTTKTLLTENQRIAYVGVVRLAIAEMVDELANIERAKGAKKEIDVAVEAMKMWGQKMMVRLYSHMELDAAEQIMIEQLSEHGLQADDLTPSLMQNSRVKNPVAAEEVSNKDPVASTDDADADTADSKAKDGIGEESKQRESQPEANSDSSKPSEFHDVKATDKEEEAADTKASDKNEEDVPPAYDEPLPAYKANEDGDVPAVQSASDLPKSENIDIDIKWTVLCDLFLILISDSIYDSRSRSLLERVAANLDVSWLDVRRFEKRVTDALEMQEAEDKDVWDEQEHMETRRKLARKRRLMMVGLATVGGGLVIGLSAGLLAPVIGAGLAAGFTTIGVTGTSGFLAGAGGAAVIGTGSALAGGTIGGRAANRRTGSVRTFEYKPLHDNKRVNLILTISGWMSGKVDDVRLPFSTIDPIMGDIYSLLWEPEILQSMGDTINILATEALTQGLQQLLGATILTALMAALQLPVVLSKLSYLIDNPWSVSVDRADLAGLILADSIIDRNLGMRPITLVGYSLGSRVIFSCLRELSKKGAVGLIHNVFVFGSPVIVKKEEFLRVRTIISGRFVNGYANNDWILGYLFRATSGGIYRVAGLASVEIPGVENIDVTEHVPGHMAYRKAIPKLLKMAGFAIESEEFTEIEDPDPDNHEGRQRELINEIEEARKELQEKPAKRRFGIFKRKKLAQKKEWETYDDRLKGGVENPADPTGVLFDVESIRAEVAALAAQGLEIKEIESTLPPMKIDSSATTPSNGTVVPRPSSMLRETQSSDAVTKSNGLKDWNGSQEYFRGSANVHERAAQSEENVTMSFDEPQKKKLSTSLPRNGSSTKIEEEHEGEIQMQFEAQAPKPLPPQPTHPSRQNSPSPRLELPTEMGKTWSRTSSPRPPTTSRQPSPRPSPQHSPAVDLNRNVWADEDDEDFGKEKEVSLTFA